MKCKHCKADMIPGQAIKTMAVMSVDFIGETPSRGSTVNLRGTGQLMDCLKCPQCGFSRTTGVAYGEGEVKE